MQSYSQPPGVPLIMIVGYAVIWSAVALFILALANRKGRSRWVALVGFVPIVNMFYVLWLVSQTDKAVLDRLRTLESRPPPRVPGVSRAGTSVGQVGAK